MSSGSTPRLSIAYPIASDPANLNIDTEAVALFMDANMIPYVQQSTAPGSPVSGEFWWCTDLTNALYGMNYYDGSAWHPTNLNKVYVGATAPSVLYPNQVWINTTNSSLGVSYYNGTTWISVVPTTATNGLAIVSSGSGWVPGIPVDSTKVLKAGDTMTGLLVLSADPVAPLGAATKKYVDTETTRAETAEALLLPKANNNAVLTAALETSYVLGTAFTATQNIYVTTNATLILVTVNSANNWAFNVASTSGVALNVLMAVGQSMTFTAAIKQGATAFYCTGVSIDGVSQTVNWQGGTAPTSGFASGYDVYTVNIIKTASATYTVFASVAQF
jgi:hypothetical protein